VSGGASPTGDFWAVTITENTLVRVISMMIAARGARGPSGCHALQ
jgi:hypothetical protein